MMSEKCNGESKDNVVKLVSEDNVNFTIDVEAARGSNYLSNFIDSCDPSEPIPISTVKSNILDKAIEYLNYYKSHKPKEVPKPLPSKPFKELVSEWDYKFATQEYPIMFELIMAANYLDIPGALELCCAKVASEIRGRSVEEIRSIFQVENDFTAEEEKQIKEENRWCDPE